MQDRSHSEPHRPSASAGAVRGTALLTLAALAGVAAVATCCGGADRTDFGPLSGDKAMTHVKAMVGFGPRPAGSEALAQNADYIRDELKKLGVTAHYQEFEDQVNAPGIQFRNVWCELPGEDPKAGPMILLGAHYDTKLMEGHGDPAKDFRFVGAIDGAGASSVLIELVRELQKRKNKLNVRFVWFDGEESIPWTWDNDRSLFGSRHHARQMKKDESAKRLKAMILLDLIGSKNFKIDRDFASQESLSDLFLAAAKDLGAEDKMFRFKSVMTDDHIPFREEIGCHVIDLIDFRFRQPGDVYQRGDKGGPPADGEFSAWWHTADDDVHSMDPAALDFAGNLVLTAMPRLEEKYAK